MGRNTLPGVEDADLRTLPTCGIKKPHLCPSSVHLHRMSWGMGDPGCQPGRVHVLGRKLAKPLVAVEPLARTRRLGNVAAPQHLQGHFVAPGVRFGHLIEIDRYEIPLRVAAPVDKTVRQFIISNTAQLLACLDVAFGESIAGLFSPFI